MQLFYQLQSNIVATAEYPNYLLQIGLVSLVCCASLYYFCIHECTNSKTVVRD